MVSLNHMPIHEPITVQSEEGALWLAKSESGTLLESAVWDPSLERTWTKKWGESVPEEEQVY